MKTAHSVTCLICFVGFHLGQNNKVTAFKEDDRFGPGIFRQGKIRKPESGKEVVLMVHDGNLAMSFTNFTGYFLGFEFYARKEAFLNLQIYKQRTVTDAVNLFGYYQLVAETGFFKTTKGRQKTFFGKSYTLVRDDVIIAAMYRKGGNPIPYKTSDDCSRHAVLYSDSAFTSDVLSEVNFVERNCHIYALNGLVLQTDYAELECDMHIASTTGVTFIESHTDLNLAVYPDNYYKCWIIRPESEEQEVHLESALFQIESSVNSSCEYDVTRIYSFRLGSSLKKIASHCGSKKVRKTSTQAGKYIFLDMTTDHSYAFAGFYIGASSIVSRAVLPVDVIVTSCIAAGFLFAVLALVGLVYRARRFQTASSENISKESSESSFLDESEPKLDCGRMMFSKALAYNNGIYGQRQQSEFSNSEFYYGDAPNFKGRSDFRTPDSKAPLMPFTTLDGSSYTPVAVYNPGYYHTPTTDPYNGRSGYGRLFWRQTKNGMYSTLGKNISINTEGSVDSMPPSEPHHRGYYRGMLGEGPNPALLFSTARDHNPIITSYSNHYSSKGPGASPAVFSAK